MASLNINYRFIFRAFAIVSFFAFTWFFPHIILYIFLAFILALMGKPLANQISRIKIYKWKIPYGLSAFILISLFICLFILFFVLFVPLLFQEIKIIENINYEHLSLYLTEMLNNVQQFLHDYGIMDSRETIVGAITSEVKNLLSVELFSNVLGGVVSTTGNFVMALFTIFFVAFFFIKDKVTIDQLTKIFVSKKYVNRLGVVSENINNLLSRYCIGSVIRILIMIVLLYIGLLIFGIRGALFLAFLGGVLNIIPYLGPIIGLIITWFFGFIDCVSMELYPQIVPFIVKTSIVYVAANVVDNVVLQPLIFSQSVNIHPVEVFLVTIIGGDIAGIGGMILAIPVYTILRIIIIETYTYMSQNTTPSCENTNAKE